MPHLFHFTSENVLTTSFKIFFNIDMIDYVKLINYSENLIYIYIIKCI